MQNILDQVAEYKARIDALATKAASADSATAELATIKAELEAQTLAANEATAALATMAAGADVLKSEIEALKADISGREDAAQASDEKAREIIAGMGLKEVPVVTVAESTENTFQQICDKYASLAGREKATYYAEHRKSFAAGALVN